MKISTELFIFLVLCFVAILGLCLALIYHISQIQKLEYGEHQLIVKSDISTYFQTTLTLFVIFTFILSAVDAYDSKIEMLILFIPIIVVLFCHW